MALPGQLGWHSQRICLALRLVICVKISAIGDC